MKAVRTALRSFFRFLRVEGLCEERLEAAIPAVAGWRLSTLPHCLSDEQLARVLASLDASRPCGRRDRAIVVCLASLGLRPGELANLRLEDVDWRPLTSNAVSGVVATLGASVLRPARRDELERATPGTDPPADRVRLLDLQKTCSHSSAAAPAPHATSSLESPSGCSHSPPASPSTTASADPAERSPTTPPNSVASTA
jgi:hypothetical protein